MLARAYPVRSMLDAGLTVALSSDAPVVEDDSPLLGIQAAMSRRDEDGHAIAADQAISLDEALDAYTRGGGRRVWRRGESRPPARGDVGGPGGAVGQPERDPAGGAYLAPGYRDLGRRASGVLDLDRDDHPCSIHPRLGHELHLSATHRRRLDRCGGRRNVGRDQPRHRRSGAHRSLRRTRRLPRGYRGGGARLPGVGSSHALRTRRDTAARRPRACASWPTRSRTPWCSNAESRWPRLAGSGWWRRICSTGSPKKANAPTGGPSPRASPPSG